MDQRQVISGPLLTLGDYERAAQRLAAPEAWDFLEGGSGEELTVRENVSAFRRIRLRRRSLTGHGECDLSVSLLGARVSAPIALGPIGLQKLFHPDGEVATARAAKDLDMLFVVSMLSTVPLEDIAAVGAPFWLQLYFLKDRGRMLELIRSAESLGCRALVLTVDAPRIGRRVRDLRNGFHVPDGISPALIAGSGLQRSNVERSAVADHAREFFDPRLDWSAIAWLRSNTKLPLVLKGLARRSDVERASGEGVDAVIVSNHGGRQLDGECASIEALAEITASGAPKFELYLDGGVRCASDILKAGALGARAVLLGRPFVWGLIVGGHKGTRDALDALRADLELAMVLSGAGRWGDLDRSCLAQGHIHVERG